MTALEDREREREEKELQIVKYNAHNKDHPHSTTNPTHTINGVDSALVLVPPLDRIRPPDSLAEKTVLFSKGILRRLLRNELKSSAATKQTLREYVTYVTYVHSVILRFLSCFFFAPLS